MKVKSNNFATAKKEITAMDAELVNRIPETIAKNDSKHYHVALVKIDTRDGQVKNDVSVNVQQYHKAGFEKIKKSFIFLGFTKLVVVHDPSQPIEDVQEPTAPAKTAKQPQGDGNGPAKDENAGKTPENDPDDTDPSEAEKLEQEYQFAIGGNKPELIAFAEKHGVDLSKASNNPERVDAITAWFNEKMESMNSNE